MRSSVCTRVKSSSRQFIRQGFQQKCHAYINYKEGLVTRVCYIKGWGALSPAAGIDGLLCVQAEGKEEGGIQADAATVSGLFP